mmetsp:Transcript_21012/g.53857  ORF Transcript_21012/g.53857 Transcript_21012/m.53857 type:complete len:214 (-) Transcript_21012:455-1096(-)
MAQKLGVRHVRRSGAQPFPVVGLVPFLNGLVVADGHDGGLAAVLGPAGIRAVEQSDRGLGPHKLFKTCNPGGVEAQHRVMLVDLCPPLVLQQAAAVADHRAAREGLVRQGVTLRQRLVQLFLHGARASQCVVAEQLDHVCASAGEGVLEVLLIEAISVQHDRHAHLLQPLHKLLEVATGAGGAGVPEAGIDADGPVQLLQLLDHVVDLVAAPE